MLAAARTRCEPAIDGFEVPNFDYDVNLDQHLSDCPPSHTTRGTFFLHVYDHVRGTLGEDQARLLSVNGRRRWIPFATYSLTEFMRFAHDAARLLHGRKPTAEGLRRIGWMAYPSMAATIAGRVVLFAHGDKLEQVIPSAPKAYRIALPGADVRVVQLGDRRWRVEMRDVYNFVRSYQYGVLEGALRAHGARPNIRVCWLDRSCDADFDVRWG